MYFKNKNTGVTWYITDKDHQRRLGSDTNYLIVTNSKHQEADETHSSEPVRDSKSEKVELAGLSWHEIRALASDKGINPHGLKRDDIESQLTEILKVEGGAIAD